MIVNLPAAESNNKLFVESYLALTAHLPQFFITFIVGSVIFNGVCVLLMKPAKALAVRSVEKQGA